VEFRSNRAPLTTYIDNRARADAGGSSISTPGKYIGAQMCMLGIEISDGIDLCWWGSC